MVYLNVFRPGRLTDGPYTSYDLNTLLKATAGQRRAVLIGQGKRMIFLFIVYFPTNFHLSILLSFKCE